MDNIIACAVMRTPHADAVASHRFAAGHMVRLSRAIPLRNAAAGNYEVLAQLPERDGDLQYRIKSDREPYQRIVKEGELEQAIAQSMPELSSFRGRRRRADGGCAGPAQWDHQGRLRPLDRDHP